MPDRVIAKRFASFVWFGFLALVLAGGALAADGALDPGFWGDGRMSLAAPFLSIDELALAPDGTLLAVGQYLFDDGPTSDPGDDDVRVFWASILDDALGATCVAEAAAGFLRQQPKGAAFDASDRLVIAGLVGPSPLQGFAMRFAYPACAHDDSFNLDGTFVTDLAVNGGFHALALGAASEVFLGGDFDDEAMIFKLTAGGLVDVGWAGGDGLFQLDLPQALAIRALALQPNGRLIAAGSAAVGLGDSLLLRLTTTGSLDSSFSDDGVELYDPGFGANDGAFALALEPGGRILAAGNSLQQSYVMRLESDGQPDDAFGEGSVWLGPEGSTEAISSLALQGDGRIVAAGTRAAGGTSDFVAYRLLPGGNSDNGFGSLGAAVVEFDLGGSEADGCRTVLVTGQGIVLGGLAETAPGATAAAAARLEISLLFADGFESGDRAAWTLDVP